MVLSSPGTGGKLISIEGIVGCLVLPDGIYSRSQIRVKYGFTDGSVGWEPEAEGKCVSCLVGDVEGVQDTLG
jgi:hypothetical protein